MHFNIYVNDEIGATLMNLAKRTGKTRNALIREAIGNWLEQQTESKWPKEVLAFNGIKNFPPFEKHRKKLIPPKKDPFE